MDGQFWLLVVRRTTGHRCGMNPSRQAGLRILASTRRQVAVLFAISLSALIVNSAGLLFDATWADAGFALFSLSAVGVTLAIYAISTFTKWLIEAIDERKP